MREKNAKYGINFAPIEKSEESQKMLEKTMQKVYRNTTQN